MFCVTLQLDVDMDMLSPILLFVIVPQAHVNNVVHPTAKQTDGQRVCPGTVAVLQSILKSGTNLK